MDDQKRVYQKNENFTYEFLLNLPKAEFFTNKKSQQSNQNHNKKLLNNKKTHIFIILRRSFFSNGSSGVPLTLIAPLHYASACGAPSIAGAGHPENKKGLSGKPIQYGRLNKTTTVRFSLPTSPFSGYFNIYLKTFR
ncbi:MAG: hypothetical protein IJL70_07945, partial [Treponema sp.]|nr:hypothetical protein [Treponema sp.]